MITNEYKIKKSKDGFWSATKGKELICGGYLTETDCIIGLAGWLVNGAGLNLSLN